MSLRILTALLTLGLAAGASGEFVAPDLRRALFQKDRLPLDTDRMRALSAHLTLLASQPSKEAAAHLRARAQLLALANRLDPTNPSIRTLTRTLAQGATPAAPAPRRLREAETDVWLTVAWLQQKEAGSEGRHLGALLLDALRVFYPQHPASLRHDTSGDAARWNQVVAPLNQFSSPAVPEEPKPQPQESAFVDPFKDAEPMASAPEPWTPPIRLRENRLQTPLFVFGAKYQLKAEVVPLSLTINESQEAGPLTFGLSPSFNAPSLDLAREQTTTALLSAWPRLPEQNFAVLSTNGKRYARRNGTAIAGPATLLLHASLSGKTLREDLVFLGEVLPNGTLKSPKKSWEYLTALRSGPGGRLLIPSDLKDQLAALIILEDPGFFLKYEVLVVSSLDTALALGSQQSDPSGLASISTTFNKIREAAAGRNVGQLIAIDSVRERLTTIHSAAPYHLSAEMLLLQGSGTKRPTYLSRAILARELTRILDPLNSILNADPASLNADRMLTTWKLCREEIDGLQKYVEINDRPFFKQAYDLINELRTVSREMKNPRDDEDGPSAAASKILREIRKNHHFFQLQAASATGDPLPTKETDPAD